MDLDQIKRIQGKLNLITEEFVGQLLKSEILNNEEEIVQKVKDRWQVGRRPDGAIIGVYRSYPYYLEKLERNPSANGNVDLIDTGALRNNLKVNSSLFTNIFNVYSSDWKFNTIGDKYGYDVYGLTKDEADAFLEEAIVNIQESIVSSLYN